MATDAAPPSTEDPPTPMEDRPLGYPEATEPIKIYWRYVIPLVVIHMLALLAFVPALFSWTGVVVAILGHLTFGMLGINVGYHRLLTHQGFTCPKWARILAGDTGDLQLAGFPSPMGCRSPHAS